MSSITCTHPANLITTERGHTLKFFRESLSLNKASLNQNTIRNQLSYLIQKAAQDLAHLEPHLKYDIAKLVGKPPKSEKFHSLFHITFTQAALYLSLAVQNLNSTSLSLMLDIIEKKQNAAIPWPDTINKYPLLSKSNINTNPRGIRDFTLPNLVGSANSQETAHTSNNITALNIKALSAFSSTLPTLRALLPTYMEHY